MNLVFESAYYLPNEIDCLIYLHLIIICICIFLIIYFKKKIFKEIEIFIFTLIIAVIYYKFVESTIINPSITIHNSFQNKTYKVVEGEVDNLKPMP